MTKQNRKSGPQAIPKDTLEKAKALYMQYETLSEIGRKLNMPKTTLHYHAQKYWNDERELLKAELFQTIASSKRAQFTNMTLSTVKILERALENLANRSEPPTMAEASKASEIMATLDKITRLDDDKPTDIFSSREEPVTIEVLRKKLARDPFAEIEDVQIEETKEITHDPTTSD